MKITLLFSGLIALAAAAPADDHWPRKNQSSSGACTDCSKDGLFLKDMSATYLKNTYPLLGNGTKCTKEKAGIRRSWDALSKSERLEYLSAVKCMHKKKSKTDPKLVPGAKNRLDDYTWSHINQTNFMHVSGLLLPWHRQMIWHYEQSLRNECGYKGYLPYWEFSEYAADQSKSPIFDGSATSFGGDGRYVPHNKTVGMIPGLPTPIPLVRPAGNGGGCVQDGGLVDPADNNTFTISLGPVAPANNAPNDTYGYLPNPRCLKRDFYTPLSANNLSWPMTQKLMTSPDIHSFRPFMDYDIHPAAHQWAGGDLYDLFTSPNDPVFYLLHSQVDRLWTIWQAQDYASRGLALDGTVTFLNDPPSPNATLSTVMIMHEAGGNMPVAKAMSAIGQNSDYCYMYM